MDKRTQREHARAHIDPKLRRNLRLYLLIAVILFGAVIYEAIRYHASIWQVATGLIVGVLAGVVFSRAYKISWDKQARHVTNNIDLYGIIILVLYILFDLSRGHLVQIFTHSEAVPAISLALLAGSMYGRVLGSGRVIMRIMTEQKVFSRYHRHR